MTKQGIMTIYKWISENVTDMLFFFTLESKIHTINTSEVRMLEGKAIC